MAILFIIMRLTFFFMFTFLLVNSDFPDHPANATSNIHYDLFPFVRVYTNGTVQRFLGQDRLPPSTDPHTGVHSKDVEIQYPDFNLSVRIFLPPNQSTKLPLLVYFHGGGFFTESAFSPTYHHHLNTLTSRAKVMAVSVNYRLAPEHPLPAAYQDSWEALKWTFSGNDTWLKQYADFGRVYLGGDSAGANIAHHMSILVGSKNPYPNVNVMGMFLNCPHFWGKTPIGNETAYPLYDKVGELWTYAYPSSSGNDDPLVNPGMDPELRNVGCKRVLVYVAGLDVLRFRGLYYGQLLKNSGWGGDVKVVEVPEVDHVFALNQPTSPRSRAMINSLAYFMSRH